MPNRSLIQRRAELVTSLEQAPADFADDIAEAHALEREPERESFTTPLVFSAPGTADAVVTLTKDVTRRLAGRLEAPRWKVGKLARAYRRSPRTGAQPFAVVRIVSVTRERITWITAADVKREGFPDCSTEQFIDMFKALHPAQGRWPCDVWRIEFAYVRPLPTVEGR